MRESEHLTPLQLLNLAAGEPLDATLVAHAESCARCREELRAVEQERAAMAPFLRPEERADAFAARLAEERERGRRRWWRWAAPALGLVAAILVAVIALPRGGPDGPGGPGDGGAHLKGAALVVTVHLQRDGEMTTTTAPRVPAQAGDRVRLGVRAPAEGWVSVSGFADGAFVEVPDLAQLAVQPGGEFVLPGSLVLGCDGPTETLRVDFASAEAAAADTNLSTTIVFDCERP